MSVYLKLVNIQNKLKAKKSQYNKFGNYYYRTCEDVLEALKPLLLEEKSIINLCDEIVLIGDRYYVKATAKLIDAENVESIESIAYAREEECKPKMDTSQTTGSASSYARKYALNGLFAIDDTKDSDTTNTEDKTDSKPAQTNNNTNIQPNMKPIEEPVLISEAQRKRMYAISNGKDQNKVKDILSKYKFSSSKDVTKDKYKNICDEIEKL